MWRYVILKDGVFCFNWHFLVVFFSSLSMVLIIYVDIDSGHSGKNFAAVHIVSELNQCQLKNF
jgi:hypothetical protein